MHRLLSALLLIALLTTSCSKEESVQPMPKSGSNGANPKNASATPVPGTDIGQSCPQDLGHANRPRPGVDNADTGTGISDDGEDLSDSEKSRKKRR